MGCGCDSRLRYWKGDFSVGVEYFYPDLLLSKKKNIHKFYIHADINTVEFKPRSFNAVLLIDVIEHLDKTLALKLLDKITKISRKKVIVITPCGYLEQEAVKGENNLQAHKSGWEIKELIDMGFKAYGLNGLKLFRKSQQSLYAEREKSLTSRIKFKPKIFWLIIAEISQIFTIA